MATRLGEMEALAKRCEKVGWRVEVGNDGWHVWDTDNRKHVLHRSLSDGNAGMANQLAALNRGGLKEAEKRMVAARNVARKEAAAKIKFQEAQELQAAQKRAEAQQDAVSRAAGPYLVEPEQIGLDWLVTPHPSPWMRWVWITPDLMDKILADYNSANRPPSPKQIAHYRNIILSGQWKLTHQGLAFDTRGILQDGQHRGFGLCAARDALVNAGKMEDAAALRIPFAVFVGMPVENFAAIDEGLLRKAGQMFAMKDEKYANNIGSVVRLANAYPEPNPRAFMRGRATNGQVLDWFDVDPEHFRQAARWSSLNWRNVQASQAGLGAAWYVLGRINGFDNAYFHAFFEGLATGLKVGTRMVLDDDDPREVARRRFNKIKNSGGRMNGIDVMAILIICWNNFVSSRSPRFINYSEEAPVPAVIICKPGEGAKPAKLIGEDLRLLLVGQEARG